MLKTKKQITFNIRQVSCARYGDFNEEKKSFHVIGFDCHVCTSRISSQHLWHVRVRPFAHLAVVHSSSVWNAAISSTWPEKQTGWWSRIPWGWQRQQGKKKNFTVRLGCLGNDSRAQPHISLSVGGESSSRCCSLSVVHSNPQCLRLW